MVFLIISRTDYEFKESWFDHGNQTGASRRVVGSLRYASIYQMKGTFLILIR
jgi:hypothetical protein